jgi:hypothetical protein
LSRVSRCQPHPHTHTLTHTIATLFAQWSVVVGGVTATVFSVSTARGLAQSGFADSTAASESVGSDIYLLGPGIHYPDTAGIIKLIARWPEAAVYTADEFADVAHAP